ncbi:MAG: sigma-70 family RNA polymerase sigma factor [Myxococcales bacterium]|nr:sigma-70 family RNA polymerase sigma factor [Myxococcales bacterium]
MSHLRAIDGGASADAAAAPVEEGAPSDAQLVLAARQGEGWAAEALFRRHVRRIGQLAYRLAPRPQEADDLVQDAFVAALDGLRRLDEPAAFGAWLRAIVVRTAAKRIRRVRLRQKLGLAHAEPLDVERVVSREAPPDVAAELSALYSRLHEMPAQVRIALVLRRVEGMTVPEVAREMGVSEPTVKRRLAQGERLLARYERGRGEA